MSSPAISATVLAARHTTTGDHVLGVLAGVFTAVLLVGIVLLVVRWPRMRGARTRGQALDRAFGAGAGRRVGFGLLGMAAVLLVGGLVVRLTGG